MSEQKEEEVVENAQIAASASEQAGAAAQESPTSPVKEEEKEQQQQIQESQVEEQQQPQQQQEEEKKEEDKKDNREEEKKEVGQQLQTQVEEQKQQSRQASRQQRPRKDGKKGDKKDNKKMTKKQIQELEEKERQLKIQQEEEERKRQQEEEEQRRKQKEEEDAEKKRIEDEMIANGEMEEVDTEVDEDIPEEEYQEILKKWEEVQEQRRKENEELKAIGLDIDEPKEGEEEAPQPQKPPTTRKVMKKVRRIKEKPPMTEEEMQRALFSEKEKKVIAYLKEKFEEDLDKFESEHWLPEYDNIVYQFLNNPDQMKLFIISKAEGIQWTTELPVLNENQFDEDFEYILKHLGMHNNYEIDYDNLEGSLICKNVKSNYLKGLLFQMEREFIPSFQSDSTWPDNVKKEFLSQIHKFMCNLTEQAYSKEFTKLYIPNEELSDIEACQQDKDLINRLETTLLYWYNQIKEVISNQDNQGDQENFGPLEEISQWTQRQRNLSQIAEQLENPKLQAIKTFLKSVGVENSYIANFETQIQNIKQESIEAEDNLFYLKSLYDPCKQLLEMEPKHIPQLLPKLLIRVRMIWEKSKFYKTSDKISGLLHKISNEIIKRCRSEISIKDMLDGDVENCIEKLQDSIECGEKWRKIYDKLSIMINTKNRLQPNAPKWDFNINSIFAQVEAFGQRCGELKEICEGQLQFARRGKGTKIPEFGGSRGPEIVSILKEIKKSFKKQIDKIRQEEDQVLNVKASKWHDIFNSFKNGMKDLDVMYQNIINFAFESVTNVHYGVEMLEAFDYLAKRESIKAAVKKKAAYVISMFVKELDNTKLEFDSKSNGKKLDFIPINQGKLSGMSLWARSLIHRIDRMKISIDRLVFIDDSIKRSAYEKYENFMQSFRNYIIQDRLMQWKKDISDFEKDSTHFTSKLEKPVLLEIEQDEKKVHHEILIKRAGHVQSTFDLQLYKLLLEIPLWKKLIPIGTSIPQAADDIGTLHKESLRVLREYVMLVVRDYNKIIDSIGQVEIQIFKGQLSVKKLFEEHLANAQKIVSKGKAPRGQVKWSSKITLEGYVRACRSSCANLYGILTKFRVNTQKIYDKCQWISQQNISKFDKKKVYEVRAFEEDLEKNRKEVMSKLKTALDEIRKILCDTYDDFFPQKEKIQVVWFQYIHFIDIKIEEALKKSVRSSLNDLYQSIIDDKAQIFKLQVELEQQQLGFRPTKDYLIQMVRTTTAAMTEVIRDFKRMVELMKSERKQRLEEFQQNQEREAGMLGRVMRPTNQIAEESAEIKQAMSSKTDNYYENISEDKEVEKTTDRILHSLKKTCDKLDDLLDPWKKQEQHWRNIGQKERFAKAMVDRSDPVIYLRSHIETFETKQSEISSQKTSDKCGCILLDNTSIKTQLVELLFMWQTELLNAILHKAVSDLNNLYQLFMSSEVKLSEIPKDLYELNDSQKLWKQLMNEKPQNEANLGPLEEKFALLESYQVNLKEEEMTKRSGLRDAWVKFNEMLEEIRIRNDKINSELEQDTNKKLVDFMREASDNKAQFQANAPYQSLNITNEQAFGILADYKELMQLMRQRENEMKFGFDLFNINYVPSPDLKDVEDAIEQLEQVWKDKERWDQKWEEIKETQFLDVNIEQLDDMADDFQSDINDYSKEMKKQEVVNNLKNTIETFKNTLPLIKCLREPYMRERHWEQLSKALGSTVRPELENFNLEKIADVKLIQFSDQVREITEVASKQYEIERALTKIQENWASKNLEMDPYKKIFKIKKVDDIFQLLEDDMATLSSQKTSPFYGAFQTEIEAWEATLQTVQECLEMVLQVQREWIYLEQIFANQQNNTDKQLIGDINKFSALSVNFGNHMNRLNNEKNVRKCLCVEGFQQELMEMSKKLDEIQKALLQLLELKRKDFRRFFFVSNDDLFELLGNAKNPYVVNKHIKKCFEGIKKLEVKATQQVVGRSQKQEVYSIEGMTSPDGELVKYQASVECTLGVENWLKEVEKAMWANLKNCLKMCLGGMSKDKKDMKWVDKWITENCGQLIITASQMQWTSECESALQVIFNQDKSDTMKAWKQTRDGKKNFIDELTKLVRKAQSESMRLKIIALITIEVHARDIIDYLQKNCKSPYSFDWLKQLRFAKAKDANEASLEVKVLQAAGAEFSYGFEYQGNNGRLVVTPLTDRCYLTLTLAMLLNKGGAPQGPAGTGKTETVKDLGKNMAMFVLVFNCSEGLDYKSMGRMFSGLAQTGSWGCFDEFNRIEIEVLSVVASQIHSILEALENFETKQDFNLEGDTIPINKSVAIFITMNPGYAGRTELPDNLKSLFRPISMMVPESHLICEIMLQAEGFKYVRPKDEKPMSQKIVTLYKLMEQQLSKQYHYDFGLRAIKSVLTCAGAIKRNKVMEVSKEKEGENQEKDMEQKIIMRAIIDMNAPKFVNEDLPLFNALFQDLFPDIDLPDSTNLVLYEQLEEEMKKSGKVVFPSQLVKVIQLFDSKNTRHGNMLVGATLSGKSTVWQYLKRAMNSINKSKGGKYPGVGLEILNPKSVSIDELFGVVDPVSNEWNDGVLSTMMSRLCKEETNDQRWMILDGPVDTLWIESMNTVLDDNKVLTLLNGDRISMPPNMGLVFEVDDLSVASPATVSRCGMIYVDINELGWEPYAESWIDMITNDENLKDVLFDLFEKWIGKMLLVKRTMCKELVKISNNEAVQCFCKLLESLQKDDYSLNFTNPQKDDIYYNRLEKWFTFALTWSLGASVNEEGRNIFDNQMREIESMFPNTGTVYDYYVNNEKNEWASWDEKIGTGWKPAPNTPFHKIFVLTTDTTRNRFVISALLKNKFPVLAVGITGTGKTALINGILADLDDTQFQNFSIVFSGQTSSLKLQDIVESKLIKRTKNKMVPDGKKAVIFIDDLNMPRKDLFGSQPPLELLRQWFDYQGWFDRKQRDLFKFILDIQFIAAMGPPGGGRAEISKRVQSKFCLLNFTFPSDKQVQKIFYSILAHKFSDFKDNEIKMLAEPIAIATSNLYKSVIDNFLPTPKKSHYLFNLRDMSKVIQGLYQVNRHYYDTQISILRVWVHECLRIFHDRLISFEDRAQLKKLVSDQLELTLGSNYVACTNEQLQDTIFVDFLDESVSGVYQEVAYTDRANLKQYMEEKLGEYNQKKDAVSYVCKIHRIIKLGLLFFNRFSNKIQKGKGHGMLVGEGGSGRHSLTKLSSFMAGYQAYQIQISKNYRLKEFRDDIKQWCELCGKKDQPCVFMFSDNEIINESFLEDINNILSVGEIPNLFTQKEDLPPMRDRLRKDYLKLTGQGKDAKILDDQLFDFFMTRTQQNFHLMLLMNQTSDNLRNYSRMYPGLVNNTTMIWFMPWPEEALVEVADRYLEGMNFNEELKINLANFFGNAHTKVLEYSARMFSQLKRLYHVTPTNYIELVNGYQELLKQKQRDLSSEIRKLTDGLQKLIDAAKNNETLTDQLNENQAQLTTKTKEVEDLWVKIDNEMVNISDSQKQVEVKTTDLDKKKKDIEQLAADAQAEVDKVEPALREAETNLAKLTVQSLAEIKAYKKPPTTVAVVLQVVMTILGHDPSWASAQKELASPDFLKTLKNYDKDNITEKTIKKIEKFTHRSDMDKQKVHTVSTAAGFMWEWVLAMEDYGKAFTELKPKKIKVQMLKEKLQKSEEELASLRERLLKNQQKIVELQSTLDQCSKDKEQYALDTTYMQKKLERAEKLVGGLAATKDGWENRKKVLEQMYEYLVGDCLITAAMLSYAGPFPSEYRDELKQDVLIANVRHLKINYNAQYNFSEFLCKPTEFLKWTTKCNLPDDNFSKENAVLVTKGRRWPLMIDPQIQANIWVKAMEKENNLLTLDPHSDNYMTKIETAISKGMVVLFQNIDENLDASMEPILNKSIKKFGGKYTLMMGSKEILYDEKFKLYMTTKMANPKYPAEVTTRVTLVNFQVKEQGLEEQLLSVVITKEKKELEITKKEQVEKKADNERKLKELDDNILLRLSETKGELVDDEELIAALEESKDIEEEAKKAIDNADAVMKKTFAARNNYRPLANLGSKLFFIINEFSALDHMYQFALETYIKNIFEPCIDSKSREQQGGDSIQEKLLEVSKRLKQEVYRYASRGLFEKDKLLLGLQLAVKLSKVKEKKAPVKEDEEKKKQAMPANVAMEEPEEEEGIDMDEYNFFLRGSSSLEKKIPTTNPNPEWITDQSWEMICAMQEMPNFNGIIGAFVHNSKEFLRWYRSATPETDLLPAEWEKNCNKLQRMILIKAIRPDRVRFATMIFVKEKLGDDRFVKNETVNWQSLLLEPNLITKITPIIFILAPGVDPFPQLDQLAKNNGRQLTPISLGQGQSKRAKEKIQEGMTKGYWIYLANCHLSLGFLKDLEKILEEQEQKKDQTVETYRMFLSTNPHEQFPISILQKSMKITTEPPKGLKPNMMRLYMQMAEDKFQNKSMTGERMKFYKRLLFSLCWLHSLVIERKKFRTLGWNVSYDFNDSDFSTADKILQIFLDDQAPTQNAGSGEKLPWASIKFLISEVTYGGRVTDDWDRKLLNVYANEYFHDKVLDPEKYKLGNEQNSQYFIPDEPTLKEHQQKVDQLHQQNIIKGDSKAPIYNPFVYHIESFPQIESPEAFGQHINAEISSQIADTNQLIESIISLQPRLDSVGGESREEKVAHTIKELKDMVPAQINIEEVKEVQMKYGSVDSANALKVVLFQEIARYNSLIALVSDSLDNLQKGINGFVVISAELEQLLDNLFFNKVPEKWKIYYHSLKPLSNWMADLIERVMQFNSWGFKGQPAIFWISGFTFPTGFTTALLQQHARRYQDPIDSFDWDYVFFQQDTNFQQGAKEGAYIRGLFLEGAKWDYEKGQIVDAEPMKLYYQMPIIHFKPCYAEAKGKQKHKEKTYQCPTYMYPIRTGVRERPSYMFTIYLPIKQQASGSSTSDVDYWTKRGTALLMSLAH